MDFFEDELTLSSRRPAPGENASSLVLFFPTDGNGSECLLIDLPLDFERALSTALVGSIPISFKCCSKSLTVV